MYATYWLLTIYCVWVTERCEARRREPRGRQFRVDLARWGMEHGWNMVSSDFVCANRTFNRATSSLWGKLDRVREIWRIWEESVPIFTPSQDSNLNLTTWLSLDTFISFESQLYTLLLLLPTYLKLTLAPCLRPCCRACCCFYTFRLSNQRCKRDHS